MQDAEAYFNHLVNEYSEKLYWHVRAMVGSHEDADDLMQDIFTKVWKALPGFRGDSKEFTWLWRIATNETLNFLRKEKLRQFFRGSVTSAEAFEVAAISGVDGDSAEITLHKAVSSLPEKQRTVFCMRYYEELPYEQIAAITGTSEGALKASYHLAFEKVKAFVANND